MVLCNPPVKGTVNRMDQRSFVKLMSKNSISEHIENSESDGFKIFLSHQHEAFHYILSYTVTATFPWWRGGRSTHLLRGVPHQAGRHAPAPAAQARPARQ
jgi:hypothetical protein